MDLTGVFYSASFLTGDQMKGLATLASLALIGGLAAKVFGSKKTPPSP